ncbi:hypothetical protein AAE478_008953 [Parahypoxylon ruwenzoriense]
MDWVTRAAHSFASFEHLAMDSGFTKAVAGIIVTYVLFQALLRLTQDPREPPLVSTFIPFLSPVFGMVKGNSRFYNQMRDKYPSLPIYTLRLPGTRLYIINSTSLIPVVQRQHRVLSFAPVEARATKTFMGASKPGIEIVSRNMGSDDGFVPGFLRAVHPALSAGPELDDLNKNSIQVITASLDELATRSPTTLKMYKWVTNELFFATTDAVFGPKNPLRDEINLKTCKYEPALMLLMLDVLPNVLAHEGIKAREFLVKSFERYFLEGGHTEGSGYIQRRSAYMKEKGISLTDIARFEVGGVFALVGNTIPTSFWLLYRIFSNPAVLDDCRREVSNAVHLEDGVHTIRLSHIKDSCPILLSTYQEVFRFHGMGTSARVALEDHLLDNKYLIKKGNTILIPARLQHTSKDVWGGDVDGFEYKRFVKHPNSKRYNPVAFRGFGGGTTLCPGRHFATTEILLFTAMTILRFDISPVEGSWPFPPAEKSSQAAAMDQPDYDIEIKVQPYGEQAKQRWQVSFPGSDTETAITAEDIPGDHIESSK